MKIKKKKKSLTLLAFLQIFGQTFMYKKKKKSATWKKRSVEPVEHYEMTNYSQVRMQPQAFGTSTGLDFHFQKSKFSGLSSCLLHI